MLWNTIALNEKPDTSNVLEARPILSEKYITEEDVKVVVENSFGSNIEVVDYHTKPVSEEKLGFLGAHRNLNVTIQRPDCVEKEMYSYFLKAVPYDNEEQASAIVECKAFYKETNFYRYIAPELLKSVEDKSFIAHCYFIKDDAMVFENLTLKNFRIKDKLLDSISLKSALSNFAKLHVASILAEKRLGKTLVELYPDIFKEWLFIKTGKFYQWFRTSVNSLVAVAKYLQLNDQNIPKICDRIFNLISTSKTKQNVVCHGDPKSLNIMFDQSQPLPNCVLVDFQLIRYVPPMVDVVQFIYLNSTRELRENVEKDLLQHYYTVFSNTLQKGNTKERIPTYNDILQEYQEFRLIGLVTNALYSLTNHIEGTKCAELTKNSDNFSKLIFEDREELILKIMQEDVKYKEILKEIITEINEQAADLLQD